MNHAPETISVSTLSKHCFFEPFRETIWAFHTQRHCSTQGLIWLILQQGWGLGKGRRLNPCPRHLCRSFLPDSGKNLTVAPSVVVSLRGLTCSSNSSGEQHFGAPQPSVIPVFCLSLLRFKMQNRQAVDLREDSAMCYFGRWAPKVGQGSQFTRTPDRDSHYYR